MRKRMCRSWEKLRNNLWCIGLLAVLLPCGVMFAGFVGAGRQSAVGGISINVEGVVGPAVPDAREQLLADMRKAIKSPVGEIAMPVELRMISLNALEAACREAAQNSTARLPDEIRYLAGLQRIQYVFVYPEEHDIVLAGPGEGWKVDDNANVVGVTTGRPVLRLDDLLVAMRSVEQARQGGISVSIDPTEEGIRQLNQLLSRQKGVNTMTPALESAMKQAFGPQRVTISGVPATSHFARVLLAADYRMKRLAMKLDPSPVKQLPSYLDVIRNARASAIASSRPRWWLACNYQPLATSPDGLAWELRGPGVKAMTEDEIVSASGKRTVTGKTSPAAQGWADLMTTHYDELSARDGVFGELRNLMDMCVVAALIQKEQLAERAGASFPVLTSTASELAVDEWHAPKMISPEVSFLRGRDSLIVTASGGVSIESWQVADRKEIVPSVAQIREKASRGDRNSLWW